MFRSFELDLDREDLPGCTMSIGEDGIFLLTQEKLYLSLKIDPLIYNVSKILGPNRMDLEIGLKLYLGKR